MSLVIEKISETLAAKMKKNVGDETKYELDELEFGLKIIFNTVAIIGLTLILGAILHIFVQVVVVMIAFAGLRAITGGYHLKSSDSCVIVSVGTMLIIAECSKFLTNELVLYATMLSSLLVLILAPRNMTIYYLRSSKKINNILLKFVSLFIVILSYFLHNTMISLTFLVQCLTLIPKEE